jgi:hypothetical protein
MSLPSGHKGTALAWVAAVVVIGCGGPRMAANGEPEAGMAATAPDGGGLPADGGSIEAVPVAEHLDVDLTGRWALFQFEDPLALELAQTGHTITGRGCAGGLPQPDDGPSLDGYCGPVSGTIEGLRVKLSFPNMFGPYAADMFASADGHRMAGLFHDTSAWRSSFAFLRIGPADRWMPREDAARLGSDISTRYGRYVLEPVGAAPDLEVVRPCDPSGCYLVTLSERLPMADVALGGTLGSFWATELRWNEDEQTLAAGPVTVTSPKIPTALALAFDGPTLLTVRATMPSGAVFLFSATRLR